MPPRIKALRSCPILFAHRGGNFSSMGHRENSLEAFSLSLELGKEASSSLEDIGFQGMGLESDVQMTKDKIAVLSHDDKSQTKSRRGGIKIPSRVFKRKISETEYLDLPDWVLSLEVFFQNLAAEKMEFEFSLDIKNPDAFKGVLEIADQFKIPVEKLWICSPDFELLKKWRQDSPSVNFIHSTSLSQLENSTEKHLHNLSQIGISGFNLHHSEHSGGLTSLLHRFELLAFGWGANQIREIMKLLDSGVDGIYSDYPELLIAGLKEIY